MYKQNFYFNQHEISKTDINLNENATAHYFNVEIDSGNRMWMKISVLFECRTESLAEAIEMKLSAATFSVTTGGEQVAAIGTVYSDEAVLSMCVISHIHCGQPPGTHTLILSLNITLTNPFISHS